MNQKSSYVGLLGIIAVISVSFWAPIPSFIPPNADAHNPNETSDLNSDKTNNLSYSCLDPGDWVMLEPEGGFFGDILVPGKYGHVVMFCGTVKEEESIWDCENKKWLTRGTAYVIHSTKKNGLGYTAWEIAVNDHADFAIALEVPSLNASQKLAAVNFLKERLEGGVDGYPNGPQYDWGWYSKQIEANATNPLSGVCGYYCSEAIWAAYKGVYGIDLDPSGDSWSWATSYGVSPDDLLNDPDSRQVAYAD